jgi:hypothetical protein
MTVLSTLLDLSVSQGTQTYAIALCTSGRQVLHLAAERCAIKKVRRPLADAPLISDQPELTIARLRYSLGGDRPPLSLRGKLPTILTHCFRSRLII